MLGWMLSSPARAKLRFLSEVAVWSRMLVCTLAAAAPSGPVRAQDYPARTVEMVVPSTPASTADLLGRVLAEGLSRELGQRFIIVNKSGAAGMIGTAAVAQAAPDGYTLFHGAAYSITVLPLTEMAVPYDYKSFEPICQTFKNEQVIVTRPDSALRSVQDIVETARKRPGVLSYGHPGLTTIPHLAMTELSRMAKVELNQIPFKGPAEAVQMSHAGQIDFASVPLPSAAASGLRFLGLFAPARNPLLADVPTLKEQGYDIAPLSFGAFVAPRGLPAAVKMRLGDACRSAALGDAYVQAARSVFQPSGYYGDSTTLAENLAKDVAEKRRLLAELKLLK
jgi:tripartite-type tricarboxylate transporter receptor subunit TctC